MALQIIMPFVRMLIRIQIKTRKKSGSISELAHQQLVEQCRKSITQEKKE